MVLRHVREKLAQKGLPSPEQMGHNIGIELCIIENGLCSCAANDKAPGHICERYQQIGETIAYRVIKHYVIPILGAVCIFLYATEDVDLAYHPEPIEVAYLCLECAE
jgi:hypothetical protein